MRIVTLFVDAANGLTASIGSKDIIDQRLCIFFVELATVEFVAGLINAFRNRGRDFCVVALLAQSIGCDKRIDLIRNRRCLGVEKVEEIALVVVSTSGNFDPEIPFCIGFRAPRLIAAVAAHYFIDTRRISIEHPRRTLAFGYELPANAL